jgi:myo-inositol 2-dehydrogenase/D-chiro-inositol 1-dehydrogenase
VSGPVRIALVGAGRMGQVHLSALRSSDEIELAAIVEPAGAVRSRLDGLGVPLYETPSALIADGAAEGVLIAAPSDQHAELVTTFAAAGLAVLCEKPLGVAVEQAAAAHEAAAGHGTSLQVGYWRRFVPELQALRARIARGELGEIYQLSCMQWDQEPPSAEFRAHCGGIAIDMGVHELDQTRWLLGQEFDWVAAVPGGTLPVEAASAADPDAAVILARLSHGAAATISLGRQFMYADSCWLEVWGTDGYERLPFMWDADVWAPGSSPVFLGAMRAQAEAFARTIRGAPQEGAGGADAVAALEAAARIAAALGEAAVRAEPVVSGPPGPR